MKHAHLLFALFIGLLFSACETLVEIDIPEREPKIVVNCFIEPDSAFYFDVSLSKGIAENGDLEFLKNAVITLTNAQGDEEIVSTVVTRTVGYVSRTFYMSAMKAKNGESYSVHVSHPDHGEVTSTSIVPQGVEIVSLDTSTVFDSGYPMSRLTLQFQDQAGVSNYYELKVRMYGVTIKYDETNWEMGDTILGFTDVYYYFPSDVAFETGNGNTFEDGLFDGELYTIQVNYDKWEIEYAKSLAFMFPGVRPYLLPELRNISKDYYDYLTTLNIYQNAEGDPFAQPVQVYTNIENGLGIFAGFGKANDTIWLD